MNMKEIAKLAGVSVATVSYALNGTGNVSEKKRQEILEIVGKEGYSPNRIAKSLRTKRSNTIGIMVEDITAFQTPRIINGINEYVEEKGYTVILNDMGFLKKVGKNFEAVRKHKNILEKGMRLFEKAQVDGIVYVAMHDRDVSNLLPPSKIPVVLVYCYDTNRQNYCVTYDNVDISREIAGFLISRKHTELGIICGLDTSKPARKRYCGYEDGLREHGMELKEAFVFSGDWEFEAGEAAYRKYRNLKQKPTAIFAMNDLMAVGFMDAALDDGVRIPGEISIIGFDNRQECRFTRPRLTTIDIPLEKMGMESGKLIMEVIRKEQITDKKIILPCQLLEKGSVSENSR